jgi:hypothetical protein
MKTWIIVLIILLLAGVVYAYNNPSFFDSIKNNIPIGNSMCTPNWIIMGAWTGDEICKSVCYNEYRVNSFKKDNSNIGGIAFAGCYCDVNNCNNPDCYSICKKTMPMTIRAYLESKASVDCSGLDFDDYVCCCVQS